MSLVCAQCSRINPSEAAYCYHDGAALAGRAGGPINAGAAPFPNQFVFPGGQACRNFDQFAVTCQQQWPAAIDLLKQGFLGSFFGGMGRVDLAMAAQEAAKFPDIDRGLDQFLAKLPTQALQAPKLQAEPSEINLGQIKINDNRDTELHLTNLGMRLLYGTVTSDCKWLTLGDAPGHPEKMFQFGSDAIIPVHVRGQYLRAGTKPIEGHLVIDSNGGETLTVTVKADVPIAPYPDGLFAGAVTPRQIAEKSKAKPKDATPYFEKGDIARWYASNGWAYPVQGPIMSGMGAIQQFFEALGVAKAPKVAFTPKSLELNGAPGSTVEASIEVSTADRKVVYGWATCDQAWVEVGKTKTSGKSVTIPITVRIPSPAPPTLDATLHVFGNGNQKANVPLRVKIAGGKAGVVVQQPEEPAEVLEVVEEAPVVVEASQKPAPFAFTESSAAVTMNATAEQIRQAMADASPFAIPETPAAAPSTTTVAGDATAAPSGPPAALPLAVRLLLHVIPVGILFLCVLVLIVLDIWVSGPTKGGSDEFGIVDSRPYVMLRFDEGRQSGNTDSMNFAVHKLDPDNPGHPSVKLNYYENGFGNSTVVKIDGKDAAFGLVPEGGKWAPGSEKAGTTTGKWGGKARTFEMGGVLITQTVTIEPGDAVHDPTLVPPNDYKRLLTTCLVRYKIHNKDTRPHSVGLRVLMDTCIGDNDGVPFTLPGEREVVDKARDFKGRDVPDFVQVLEKPSLRDPGTIMQLNLRISDKLEPPSRFQITRYPVSNAKPDKKILYRWDVPTVNFDEDSAVAIYWDPRDLAPTKTRELAFMYGLGSVSVTTNKLGLTIGGATYKHGELTVLALVADREAKFATLELPPGLKLVEGSAKQPVPPTRADAEGKTRPSPVTWRVQAEAEGKHLVTVTTDSAATQSRRVTITAKSLFN